MKYYVVLFIAFIWHIGGWSLLLSEDKTSGRIYLVGSVLLCAIVTAWKDIKAKDKKTNENKN